LSGSSRKICCVGSDTSLDPVSIPEKPVLPGHPVVADGLVPDAGSFQFMDQIMAPPEGRIRQGAVPLLK
jgi:hypothetical protein